MVPVLSPSHAACRRRASREVSTTLSPIQAAAALNLVPEPTDAGNARGTGAGLFSASAISSSNSATGSGANRDTSDRQRMTCSTAMTSAFRFAGAFPVATAYAWPAMKVYQPCRNASRSSFFPTSRAPLLGRGQQPGLVELPGPHLAQNALGKRFLRDVELRLRRHHHARSRSAARPDEQRRGVRRYVGRPHADGGARAAVAVTARDAAFAAEAGS